MTRPHTVFRAATLAPALLLAACATGPADPAPPSSAATPAAAITTPPGAAAIAASAPAAAAPAAMAAPPVAAVSAASAVAPAASAVAPQTSAVRPAAAGSSPAAAPPGAPAAPPPFDVVVKDARKIEGLFTVWQKDDKNWIELRPEDLGRPLFLSPKIARGIGEKGLYGGSMASRWGGYGRPQIVKFEKVHQQVRLIAVNNEFVAQPGTPAANAVAAAFSRSLLSSAAVASAPHPERKSVLVELSGLFVNDMLGLGMTLNRAYRQAYAFDARHSGIERVRGKPDALIVEVSGHYGTSSIAYPAPGAPGAPAPAGAPMPTTPSGLPDVRSMFFGLHYSLSRLPEQPMRPRLADARVGHFTTTVQDFSRDLERTPRQSFVNRWRLEKKDPAAALSDPVNPIVFWLDKTVPLEYRDAIAAGVLEWNKAFEKIGFRNALVVRQQADDADFDTLDVGVASIRWMTNSQASFGAIGPSHVDPRSGEILDADISLESLSSRSLRTLRSQILGAGFTADWAAILQARDAAREGHLPTAKSHEAHEHGEHCEHGDFAAEQLGYALDVLESRGDLDPASPEVRQFVLDYLKDVTLHEVGHTLGLRHNFRSSRIYTDRQLSDEGFTRANGLAGSVMEYAPINLPRPGEKGGTAWQLTLGPYDYWAIEYAYKAVDPKAEAAQLQAIASRSAEPPLAFGTDEDNFLGIDPESLHFDLGDDPVAFARKRFEIGRDVVARQETRVLKPDADYSVLRRAVSYAVRDMGRAAGILARQIGGVRTLRDHPGTGRDPLLPTPAPVQREALQALSQGLFAADSLVLSAALQRRLGPSFLDRSDSFGDASPVETDFSIDAFIGQLRRATLAQLMSDGVASRIVDSRAKLAPGQAFGLDELYARLRADIWSELRQPGLIPAPRRELQREHLNRVAGFLLRPAASRTDTRGLIRQEAQALQRALREALRRPGRDAATLAHLRDSLDTLSEAMSARMQRSGL